MTASSDAAPPDDTPQEEASADDAPPSEPPQRPDDLAMVLEALLLVAEQPPTIQLLARVCGVSPDAVEEALGRIAAERGRGIRLRRYGSTAALVSAPEAGPWVERLLGLEAPNRLSQAALETLAIIAYRQPITRGAIEQARGVGSGGALRTLRARDLIEPVGRLEAPGQPLLWSVTPRFLDHFALGALAELPPLEGETPPAAQAALPLEAPEAVPEPPP